MEGTEKRREGDDREGKKKKVEKPFHQFLRTPLGRSTHHTGERGLGGPRTLPAKKLVFPLKLRILGDRL